MAGITRRRREVPQRDGSTCGTQSRVWREVVELGQQLKRLGDVADSTVEQPSVAIVHDWPAWWAAELDSHPSKDISPVSQLRRWYSALWQRAIGVDFARWGAELRSYSLVVVPCQYLVDDEATRLLTQRVASGGAAVVTYFSGIVDEHDHVRIGGYPGAFTDLLGIHVEEFAPLLPGQSARLSDGSSASLWTERGRVTDATPLLTYVSGPATGSPALTANDHGSGRAWYVGTELDDAAFGRLVDSILCACGIRPSVPGLPPGVEAIRRSRGDRSWLFLLNHTDRGIHVPVIGTDLLTGQRLAGSAKLRAGDCLVVEEADAP